MRLYFEWCERLDTPAEPLTRHLLESWVAYLLAHGAEANTARTRQQAVRRFADWLASEDEISADPFAGLSPPKLDTKVVQRFTDDQLRSLIKACAGKELRDRRDEAIVRLFANTGMRAAEMLALNVADVDLERGIATIIRGKGGTGRLVPFDAATSAAIDKYMRVRRNHKLARTAALWLTETGGAERLGYHGLRVTLNARANVAHISNFHIHKLRHTFASRWLASGGSEGGLMNVAGWRTREMVDRYTKATAAEHAADEARTLKLGDL